MKSYLYTLAHSKTNQAGAERPEDVKPLVGSAAQAMQAWLAVLTERGIQEGALFRRIRKGGASRGAARAGGGARHREGAVCDGGVEGKFSAHSLRAGFVTEAGRQNMSLPETMAMTAHHSVATVMGYFRAERALGSRVSRMLDDD